MLPPLDVFKKDSDTFCDEDKHKMYVRDKKTGKYREWNWLENLVSWIGIIGIIAALGFLGWILQQLVLLFK